MKPHTLSNRRDGLHWERRHLCRQAEASRAGRDAGAPSGIGKALDTPTGKPTAFGCCTLETCDTADWKSALRIGGTAVVNLPVRPVITKLVVAAATTVLALLTACSPQAQSPNHGEHSSDSQTKAQAVTATSSSAPKTCAEHGLSERECGICHPELAATLKPGEGLKVRLPAADSASLVGVETAPATNGAVAEVLDCYAELAFNQNKLSQLVAPVGGIVQEVPVDLGTKVEEKQPVARIWSATIAESVAKAVLTHQTLQREGKLRAERVTSERDLQQAEADHRAACQQLRTLGFTEGQIDALGAKPQEQVLMEVRAPFAGEIVERTAVRGALVEPGRSLFTLADRSVMWARLNIPETALSRVKVGQAVELLVDALPGQRFTGQLTWIGPEVDEKSRMAHARAEVPNPDGVLKAKMFARARILARRIEGAVLLPASAIYPLAGKPFVFVKLTDDLYEARAVSLGARFDGQVEVLAGLKPQEIVVVNHGFALKSQWLSSRMGAGCAD